MNGYLVLFGLFVLATAIAAPVIISDWRREARKKTKRRRSDKHPDWLPVSRSKGLETIAY